MKTLLIEPFGGVAGDMMTASLLGLGIDLEAFEQALKTLPTTESWSLILTTVERHSIIARHFLVSLDGEHYHDANGESHSHSSEHTPHHHHHRKLDDVLDIINGASGLSSAVKRRASAVFTKLAEAEAEVHGKNDPKGVHFHEVGAVDAIIDITGVCLALELLGVEKILSTPVPLGTGSVKSAHGTLPVPVPATVNILCGIPVERTNIPFELATPTGAAILATLVDEWISAPGEVQEPVSAKLAAAVMLNTSYGAGTRDIPHR
ncbi:MAG: LarC family nickel insertion protein, partial [Victivallales bacterium]|nr:LarC family nickel insertion protein [Victivallales bacterium]